MDSPYNISSSKIIRALAEAEVMSIFFPYVGKALIVDTRHNAEQGPAVLLDEMVESPHDRLRSVQKLRPGFTELGQLTLAPWISSVSAFADQGILEAIVERFQAMGYPAEADDALRVFQDLRRHERQMMRDLVAGNPQTTRTKWARTP